MPNKSSPHGGFISEGTISHGTLRTADLLRRFADEYERVLPTNSARLVAEARDMADELDGMPWKPESDDAQLILECLFESLETVAEREGMTFGAHPGDGSDFGYWATEETDDWQPCID